MMQICLHGCNNSVRRMVSISVIKMVRDQIQVASREITSFTISPVGLISFSSTKIHSKNSRHLAFWFYIMELLAESKLNQNIAS